MLLLQGLLLAVVASMSTACKTVLDYRTHCQSCVSQLVQTWRTNPDHSQCRSQYNVYIKCLNTAKDKCLGVKDSIRQQQIQVVYAQFSRNESFYCQNGIFEGLTSKEWHTLKSTCNPQLLRKAEKCQRKYKERFGRKKSSKALCKWYYKAKQCMVKAFQRNCKHSKLKAYFVQLYRHPYNPFCEKGQDYVKRVTRGDPGFGQCTEKGHMIKVRKCTVDFIQRLQKNNGHQCRSIVDTTLIPCVKRRIKRCLRGTREARSLENELTKLMENRRPHMQDKYCDGGYLETLPLSRDQCSKEYFETFQQRCYTKFKTEYRKDRVNPQLCQYYAEVNRCARNMTLTMCKLDHSMEEAAKFLYDNFNPFCPDGKDPPISPHHASHEKQKTSLNDSSITHAFSPLLLVISIVVSMTSR